MNTYELIYNELCNRVESSELSLEAAESINDVAYDRYVTERRLTPVDRHIYKFKKKYNFVPDKGTNTRGTITVDGKQYPVELDINSKTMTSDDGEEMNRQMGHEIGSNKGTIHFDKGHFRMKPKRADVMMQHEIGHANLHNFAPEYKNRMKNAAHPDVIDTHAGTASDIIYYNDKSPSAEDNKKELKKELKNTFTNDKYIAQSQSYGKDQFDSRRKMLKHMSQYDGKKSAHQNPLEYEADRYAVNHVNRGSQSNGASQMKRSIRQTYKYSRKDLNNFLNKYPLTDQEKKVATGKVNDINNADYNARAKALNDQAIANYPLYK